MNIVFAGDDKPEFNRALAGWLQARLGFSDPFREPYSTMAVFDGGELVSVLIFENYRPDNGTVEVGGASISRLWLTRPVIEAIADFSFRQLGCQMAVFKVSEKNTSLCRLMKRAGFECIVFPRMRGRDEAEHCFYMTDDNWRQNCRLNRKEAIHG